MEPTTLLPAIALFSLVTVEYGGWALLGMITRTPGYPELDEFREQFFRAGHAHAGTLLVMALAYFALLPRAGFSETVQWAAGGGLMTGILVLSGGFFLHLAKGRPGEPSVGTRVTRIGAMTLGIPLLVLAVGLVRAG